MHNSKNRIPPLFLACLLLLPSVSAFAQAAQNPLTGDTRAAYAGGALFRAQCATCHGADAKGISTIEAPDLTQIWRQRGRTDVEVFDIIQSGIPGTIMPPHDLGETETWMLVSFLRSVADSGVDELPPGDAGRGRELFANHCAQCHRAGGQVGQGGSILGPALTDILQRRDLAAIESAVRDPGAAISSGFDTVQLTLVTGQGLTGIVKNEDAFSLQMIDSDQRLRAFNKSELQDLQFPAVSLMPAFDETVMDSQALLDILNYLQVEQERVEQKDNL